MGRQEWHEVAAKAAAQHGVWATWQHRLSWAQISRWHRAGLLHRVHHGVYAVGHPALSPRGVLMAAVLAGGRGSAASHRSGADLHGWRRHRGWPEITVPRTGARRRSGIIVHVSAGLGPNEITHVDRIPVTTPERTVIDCADVLTPDAQARLVSAAERSGLIDRRTLPRLHGRRNPVRQEHVWTRSQFERRFRQAISDWGLPAGEPNQMIGAYEYDVVWRKQRVIVELDHPHTHLNPEAFELDPLKAEAAAELGFAFRRVTERRFANRPHEVRAMLARLLEGGESGAGRD